MEQSQTVPDEALAGDILIGAAAIAEELYGDSKKRRRIFHLVQTSRLPIFRLGSRICIRRTVLRQWITHQEERNGLGT